MREILLRYHSSPLSTLSSEGVGKTKTIDHTEETIKEILVWLKNNCDVNVEIVKTKVVE